MLTWPGLPPQASAQAADVVRALAIERWIIAALFVFSIAYFLYVLVRFRRGAHPRASYQGLGSGWLVYFVFAIVVTASILLIASEIPTWRTGNRNLPGEGEATVVRVVAEQFSWNVHYPGPDGRFGRTDPALVSPNNPIGLDRRDPDARDDIMTINELALLVGRPVLVHLTSKDVVHSFGIVVMRVREDAIPGQTVPVWFTPTAVGEYEIACSELCGAGHYRMRGFVSVKTETDFRAWEADQARNQ